MHSAEGSLRQSGAGAKGRSLRLETETNEVATDRIWVHSGPAGLLCMGIGPSAEVARFALTDEGDHPFYATCRRLDRDVARGGLAKAKRLGLDIPFGAVNERALRRLAIAVALSRAGFNPDEPRDERGRWTTEEGNALISARLNLSPGRQTPNSGETSVSAMPFGSFDEPTGGNSAHEDEVRTAQMLDISGHALRRMMERGITPSQVIDAIQNGTPSLQSNGNTAYSSGNIRVIVSPSGRIVTIF